MIRTLIFISAMTIALIFNGCNNTNQSESKATAESSASDSSGSKKDQDKKHTCLMPISDGDSAKYISKEVIVKGDVNHTLTLTVDSLKKMNTVMIENFEVVCQSGATMKDNKNCKGVLLKDILDKAQIKQENHKDRNFYIVARASDNYKATFSWAEIFNNPTGDNVYVLFEENGQPIKSQGEMILICKNDIKTGPRHVYWLKSIEVNRVD